jgi:hypothetical protein
MFNAIRPHIALRMTSYHPVFLFFALDCITSCYLPRIIYQTESWYSNHYTSIFIHTLYRHQYTIRLSNKAGSVIKGKMSDIIMHFKNPISIQIDRWSRRGLSALGCSQLDVGTGMIDGKRKK